MDGLPPVADRKAVLCLGTAGEGLCCRSRGGNVTSGVRDARQPAHHVVAVAGGVVVLVGDCPDPSVVIHVDQTANLIWLVDGRRILDGLRNSALPAREARLVDVAVVDRADEAVAVPGRVVADLPQKQ